MISAAFKQLFKRLKTVEKLNLRRISLSAYLGNIEQVERIKLNTARVVEENKSHSIRHSADCEPLQTRAGNHLEAFALNL
ncbi:MAG: DUF2987 domain-containing protein [Ruminococcus sp.]|nr:DUF2987 domain-containing protein [Ruminococcus sp.]